MFFSWPYPATDITDGDCVSPKGISHKNAASSRHSVNSFNLFLPVRQCLVWHFAAV